MTEQEHKMKFKFGIENVKSTIFPSKKFFFQTFYYK